MADVSVFDGDKWVSIAGDDGKGLTLTDTQTGDTLAPVDATTHATAEVNLTLNTTESDATGTNAYDGLWKIPAGLKGEKGEDGDPGQSLELKGSVDYETPQTNDGTTTNADGSVTVLQDPASYMGTAGNSLGDLWIVRYQGDASAAGKVTDGNGFVMSEAGDSTPSTPKYEWNEIGAIQGPPGSDGDAGSITLTSDVPVTFKTDCTSGGTGSFALEGSQVAPNANYQLSLTLPRGQHVYTGGSTGSGDTIKPDDQTGDFATACTGDIWVLK